MNQLLLHLLVRSNSSRLGDARLAEVRHLSPVLVLSFAGRRELWYWVIVRSDPGPFCYTADRDPLVGQGAPVLRRIWGTPVACAPEPPLDRVFRVSLANGQTLVTSLYGSAARVTVVAEGTIVESLDSRRAGQPVPEATAPGTPFVSASADTVVAALEDPSGAVARLSGLTPSMIDACRGDGPRETGEHLVAFRDGLLTGKTRFYLAQSGRLGAAAPVPTVPAPSEDDAAGPYDDGAGACRALGDRMMAALLPRLVEHALSPLRRRLAGRYRLLEKLESELSAALDFEAVRAEADLLATFRNRVPSRAVEVELPDLYHKGRSVVVRLDPSLPIQEQITRRYRQAAKLERSQAALRKRSSEVRSEIEGLESAIEGALSTGDLAGALSQRGPLAPQDRGAARSASRAPAPATPFRRFELAEDWFALVGRNDRENDELTFHVASPDDIWLHAQHVAGSHVVLRSFRRGGNPPESVLIAAAGIAAHFSKARHSRLVPVIYTQRKYVRKFRGARPGQVRCEREKTVFAEPRLPEPST